MTAMVLLGTLRVVAEDGEVATMRRWLYELLIDQHAGVLDDVTLAASEVVTNAIEHSDSGAVGEEISIAALSVGGHAIRIEVVDSGSSSSYPRISDSDIGEEHGRGLRIVHAISAGRWGSLSNDSRQVKVWFEVSLS